MIAEQRIRAFLFYASVFIFLAGLPVILSSSLGYKFDRRTFKFTKTGLIAIKTQPQGATVYFDQQLLANKTPVTINELLPGAYDVRLELDNHYPWHSQVPVEAGKVTRLERIILFSQRPDIKKLNKEGIAAFLIDQDRDAIYYIDQDESAIYRSDLNGERFERVAGFVTITPMPVFWKMSQDHARVLYYNERQIGVVSLENSPEQASQEQSFLVSTSGKILDAFWYSDSYHIILITNRSVEVVEAKSNASPVLLVTLTRKNSSAWYDLRNDTLYFLDYQPGADGRFYNNLYKLDLRSRIYSLQELMKLKPNE